MNLLKQRGRLPKKLQEFTSGGGGVSQVQEEENFCCVAAKRKTARRRGFGQRPGGQAYRRRPCFHLKAKRLSAPKGKAPRCPFASAPYRLRDYRMCEIHCAIMGYMQGRGKKRGTMDAPQQVGARFIAPRTVANAPPHQTGHNALAARRPPHRPNAPDGGGNTDGGDGNDAGAINRSTSPLKRLPATAGRRKTKHRFVFRSRKLPVGLRRGKAVLRLSASAPYVMTHHRRVEIHCSIMGYMHGWGGKRGAMRMWNGCARRAWQFALRPFWMRSRACRRRRMCWWSKVRAAFACRWARKVIAHNAEQFTAPPGRLPRPTPQSTAGRARPRAAAGRAAWW